MVRLTRITVTAALIAPLLALGLTVAAEAAPTLTDAKIVALPNDQQAMLLNPLRATAGALDAAGRGAGAGIYSGVDIDAPNRAVDLYLTDLSGAKRFLALAHTADRSAKLSNVVLHKSRFSKASLHAARDLLWKRAGSLTVELDSVSAPADGHALVLGVESRRAATAKQVPPASVTAGTGVALEYVAGQKSTPSDRYNDSAPFVANDFITNAGWNCTTGVPVKNGSGSTFIITASHCGRTGTTWYTGGGNLVGTVSNYTTWWDASIIPASVIAEEYDTGGRLFYLDSTRYSYNGDYVCQGGYTSQMVCGIKVNNQDITVTAGAERYPSFTLRGVAGYRVGGGTACQGGDSGGLVFAIDGNSTRQVRGIVHGTLNGTGGNTMIWTEALDFYNTFGVTLAN